MKLYFMYFLTFIITVLILIIIKDKIKALRLTGILMISSSVLLIIITFITKLIINNLVTTINLSTITNYLSIKFLKTSLIIFLIGLAEIGLSKYFRIKKKTSLSKSN